MSVRVRVPGGTSRPEAGERDARVARGGRAGQAHRLRLLQGTAVLMSEVPL